MSRVTRVKKAKPSKKQRRCGKCGHIVQPGESYVWWGRKTQRGGYQIFRCGKDTCYPKPSETVANQYQSMIMGAQEDFDSSDFTTKEDVAEGVRAVAETAREIGQTMTDNADSMETGFGHSTSMSDELRDRGEAWTQYAEDLDSEADSIESMESDEDPVCTECNLSEEDGNHDESTKDDDPDADDYHAFTEDTDASNEALAEQALEAAQDALSNTPE